MNSDLEGDLTMAMCRIPPGHAAMRILLPIVAIALSLFASCSGPATKKTDKSNPRVATVNYPLAFFASFLTKNVGVEVDFLAPSDGDPAFWKPDDKAIERIQSADLVLLNGAGYAKWLDRVSLSPSRSVDTSASFKKSFIELKDKVVHQHGPQGAHSHTGTAFTTWLDPDLALEQATAAHKALLNLLPSHADALKSQFVKLQSELADLGAALDAAHAKYDKQPLLASHPVYQYLARRHQWNVKSLHWEPDALPDAKAWERLATLRKTHPAKRMIWEDEPLPETRKKLNEIGIKVVVFSPCGNTPATGDYLTVMKSNIANLKKSLSAE